MTNRTYRVGLFWAGDPAAAAITLEKSRLAPTADALRRVGIAPEGIAYWGERIDEVREQLLRLDGVLVWVNPIERGRDRAVLDGLLAQIADAGAFVSAHSDVIVKMGTKEVLYRTRQMSWGCDTRLYNTVVELRERLPVCLAEGAPRVLVA